MYALTVNYIDAQTYARINCIAVFSRFAGRWSSEEAKAFEVATQRTIDEEY